MTILSVILAIFIIFTLDSGVNPSMPWIAIMVGFIADGLMSIGNGIKELAKAYREACYVRNKENSQM